jgi:hypothetical protein
MDRLDQRGIARGYTRVRDTSPARESRTCKTALGVELHTAIPFDAAARRTWAGSPPSQSGYSRWISNNKAGTHGLIHAPPAFFALGRCPMGRPTAERTHPRRTNRKPHPLPGRALVRDILCSSLLRFFAGTVDAKTAWGGDDAPDFEGEPA